MQPARRKLIKGALAAGGAAALAGCGGGGGGGGGGGESGGSGGLGGGVSSSAPSTFSLRSPTGALSSATACIARDAEQAQISRPPALTDVPADTYVRGALDIRTVSENGKVLPGDFFVGGDRLYWQIQAGGNSAVPTSFALGQPGITDTKKATRQVLLLLDNDGNIVSTVLENKGGRIMTTSCHNSISTVRRV